MWHQIHYSAWKWKLLTVVLAFRGAWNWRTKILLPLLSSIRLTTQYDLLIAWKWWLVSGWSWAHSHRGCACETFQGWTREEKNLCLEETESSFKYSGKILRTIISQWRANTFKKMYMGYYVNQTCTRPKGQILIFPPCIYRFQTRCKKPVFVDASLNDVLNKKWQKKGSQKLCLHISGADHPFALVLLSTFGWSCVCCMRLLVIRLTFCLQFK